MVGKSSERWRQLFPLFGIPENSRERRGSGSRSLPSPPRTFVAVFVLDGFGFEASRDSVLHDADELVAGGETALRLLQTGLVLAHDGREGGVEEAQEANPRKKGHRVLVLKKKVLVCFALVSRFA